MAAGSRDTFINEATVRALAAEAHRDEATEAVQRLAGLANNFGAFFVNALSRSATSRPLASLAAAAGAGFLLTPWTRGR